MSEQDIAKRAASLMKILDLAAMPGMDTVAIKLNCQPTYREEEVARKWQLAFKLAEKPGTLFDLAAELHKGTR